MAHSSAAENALHIENRKKKVIRIYFIVHINALILRNFQDFHEKNMKIILWASSLQD